MSAYDFERAEARDARDAADRAGEPHGLDCRCAECVHTFHYHPEDYR